MPYQVRWLDEGTWTMRSELLDCSSPEAAQAELAARGTTVLSITAVVAPGATSVAAIDAARWCRELRMLLGAGMTVVEAVDTLQLQTTDPARSAMHRHLAGALQQGQSLSSAMSATGAFPAVLLAGVMASERTGALIEALDEYLRYHDMMDGLRKRLVSAALYPALVLMVGAVVVLFLLWFVVPRFSATFADMRGAVTGTTAALVAASALLRAHAMALGWLAVAVIAALVWAWQRGLAGGLLVRLIDGLPPLRRQLDQFRLAKLYRALALMFRGGYTLPDALLRCNGIGLGMRWAEATERARQALLQGRDAAEAFGQAGLSDAVTDRLLRVGQRTGSFAQVLQTVSDRHGERFATSVERATRLAEPLLLLFVASAVGGVVVMMYLPVFDLAGSLR